MEVLGRIGVSVLLVLSLTCGISYSQSGLAKLAAEPAPLIPEGETNAGK